MEKFHGVGLMSGTSLDGLDIVSCYFENSQNSWNYKINKCDCIEYPKDLFDKLKSAAKISSESLIQLDNEYGKWLGYQVKAFLDIHELKPQYIASHGYTVFHQPDKGFTHQIGSGSEIFTITNIPVINNFRQSDISLGGQGAPIVPIGDKLLFGDYDICINLGGISNFSYDYAQIRKAYDICPVNIVLNHLAERNNEPFDKGGEMAKKGRLIPDFLEDLECLDYYKSKQPKSLGIEWVNEFVFSMSYFAKNKPEDLAYTFVQHIVNRIKSACMTISNVNEIKKVLLTGGGTHNTYLVEEISLALKDKFEISKPNDNLINYKEALIFAFLGLLRLKGQTNILKSVTGAKDDNIGGQLFGGKIL